VAWECLLPALTLAASSSLHAHTQAGDGQWVFLDPLNMKCLLHHYGTYEACPTTFAAKVLELESVEQVCAGAACACARVCDVRYHLCICVCVWYVRVCVCARALVFVWVCGRVVWGVCACSCVLVWETMGRALAAPPHLPAGGVGAASPPGLRPTL